MLNKIFLLIYFQALVIASTCAQSCVIQGLVTDQAGQPIPGATIYIHETLKAVQADDFGRYFLKGVRPGAYHLHAMMLGYENWSQDIVLSAGIATEVNIELNDKINTLSEVVIEADRNKLMRQESSQSVISINEKFIERKNGNNLMETLERLPGIGSINTGTGVSKPVVRGLSFARVAVTDNGIKQEGQQWGADHGLEIDQYAVENVEIIKGPGSLMYGSDAMGGVISLGHPKVLQPGTHQGEVRSIYKSNNDTYGVSAALKGNHNNWVYQARITALEYGDYKVPEDTFYFQDTYFPIFNGRLKNTAGKELHSQLMIGRNGSRGYSHLTVSNYMQRVGIFTGAIGRVTTDRLFPDGDRNIALSNQDIQHFKAISNNNVSIGKGWLESDIGFQHNTRKEYSYPHTHGQPLPENQTLALELGLSTFSSNTRYHIKHTHGWQTTLGLQHSQQFNRSGGFEFLIPAYNSHQAGLYLIEKYKMGTRWVFNAGIRGEWANQSADQTILPFYRRFVFINDVERNPKIDNTYFNYAFNAGFSWKMSPLWTAKFNAGKSFRMPTIPELTSFGMHHASYRFEQGDPNLKPEEGFQVDAEFSREGKKWTLSVSPFYYYFGNYIYQRPTGFSLELLLMVQFIPCLLQAKCINTRRHQLSFLVWRLSSNYNRYHGSSTIAI